MSPLLTGFPFGGSGIGKATYTATTGSPTVDTSSRAGKTIYKFTGSGSITVGTAGYAEVLVIGGGGGGGNGYYNNAACAGGGGGAGGYYYKTSQFLPAGTLTVTVGAGGGLTGYENSLAGNNGSDSAIGSLVSPGGGGGSVGQNIGTVFQGQAGRTGGSGGGGASCV